MKLLRPPRRILVICLRRIGDVLLCTTLIRSLRQAWPDARLEVLVNADSAAALQGNPDIDALVIQPESPSAAQWLRLAWRVFRRYDLAVSTLYNDRPFLYALLASATRVSVLPPAHEPAAAWKRRLLHGWSALELGQVHAVEQYLRLADVLGIPRVVQVVPPRPIDLTTLDAVLGTGWQHASFAVLHPSPLYRYKAWTQDGWCALATHLAARGLRVVLTGGVADRAAIARIVDALPRSVRQAIDMVAGRLALADLTPLIERAQVFVGPDTSVTHLAAATGTPTVALFGPSHPVAWGPWPAGSVIDGVSPWIMQAPLQQRGNVWLVQGLAPCVPCLQEGCERHRDSRSDCLDQLDAQRVVDVVDAALRPAAV